MRINLDNKALPGVTAENVTRGIGEIERSAIRRPDGTLAGHVVYLRRKGDGNSGYGWRPAKARTGPLLTKVDAAKKVLA